MLIISLLPRLLSNYIDINIFEVYIQLSRILVLENRDITPLWCLRANADFNIYSKGVLIFCKKWNLGDFVTSLQVELGNNRLQKIAFT